MPAVDADARRTSADLCPAALVDRADVREALLAAQATDVPFSVVKSRSTCRRALHVASSVAELECPRLRGTVNVAAPHDHARVPTACSCPATPIAESAVDDRQPLLRRAPGSTRIARASDVSSARRGGALDLVGGRGRRLAIESCHHRESAVDVVPWRQVVCDLALTSAKPMVLSIAGSIFRTSQST